MEKIKLLLLTWILVACQQQSSSSLAIEQDLLLTDSLAIISPQLINYLDELINYQDSLYNERTPYYSNHKSYWITFEEEEGSCFSRIIANFEFYSSENTNGYFEYRDKFITVYNFTDSCSFNLVEIAKLSTGKIDSLVDYDDNNPEVWNSIPDHSPYGLILELISKDSIILKRKGFL